MPKSFGDQFWEEIEKHRSKNKIDEPFEIGKVISEDPLIIEIEGLPLYRNNLYINPSLLPWDEEVKAITTTVSEHNHQIILIQHFSKLKIDSYVACYGIEYNDISKTYQKYVVLEVVQ
ncbi:hypothetical protein B0P06_005261 [Clostridium saccharoperbutylacetonicum]|uniref:Uncharacterized protein n=1 Tax=Clostridium saccharoperbutylacetonicum N1-4(HMT) TaxID=931276 RepID=M1LTV0_9CLOT|nr:DUF2577 domain-containing protein [Clostridium saccharoperbutylacetonicum]AGF56470.1 hypothetical protein DUF2577 [Clostridium saccharoperbutylacetonicum N1-4(HMT)]NRT62783.1 hypothetical protein [Clostridium saccharoperbutylacetonicum]NSB26136.1 hypothetical protein [Clostridium saccharoperbutylacetonicum]NSB45490.1 hypothetical protein [Clostridium saccharoperbutylacetonicum]